MVRAGGDSDAPSSTVSPPLQPPSLPAPPQHTVSPHDAAFAFSGTDMIGPITSLVKRVVPLSIDIDLVVTRRIRVIALLIMGCVKQWTSDNIDGMYDDLMESVKEQLSLMPGLTEAQIAKIIEQLDTAKAQWTTPFQPPSLPAPPQHTVNPHAVVFSFSGTNMIGHR